MVLHQKIGVPVVSTWGNRPQNEFIWVRTYKDKAELESKNKEFQAAVAPLESSLVATSRKRKCARPNQRSRRREFGDDERRRADQVIDGKAKMISAAA